MLAEPDEVAEILERAWTLAPIQVHGVRRASDRQEMGAAPAYVERTARGRQCEISRRARNGALDQGAVEVHLRVVDFGTGSGEGDDHKVGRGEGGAAGGGLGIEPIGFLVSRGDNINFISTKTNSGLAAAFEKVPDLLQKYLETRQLEPLGI